MKIEDAIKLPSRNKSKKERKTQLCSGCQSFRCSSSSSSWQGCNTNPVEKKKTVTCNVEDALEDEKAISVGRAARLSASMFSKLVSEAASCL